MPMRRGALLLTLALAASATPVLADFINVELTVSFFPPTAFPADSHLVGTASFYIDIVGGNGPQPTDSPGVIFLDVFARTVTALEDPSLVDPCIGDGSCGVDVSHVAPQTLVQRVQPKWRELLHDRLPSSQFRAVGYRK